MPIVKIVKPLFKLCIKSITANLEISGCVDKLNMGNKQDNNLAGISKISNYPFIHQLPVVVSEEIFKHLWKAEESLYKKLLPEHVTNAPYLHYLRLYPYYEDFLYSIPKFGKLQILEMPRTEVGDICLKLVGTYCLDLRVLNVFACSRVTDVGIQWLCVDDNPETTKGKQQGQCKAIKKLNVCLTKVTEQGIKTALRNLPTLSSIFHETKIIQVLVELTETTLDQNQECIIPFSLSRLIVSGLFLSTCFRRNDLLSSICPLLHKIDMILEKGLADIDLQCLTSLKMLREINFYRKTGQEREDIDITFDGGVAKLLEEIGSSLEKLGLSCFDVVNISTVIKLCPNLNFLAIHHTRDSGNGELLESEINRFKIEWNKREEKQMLKNLAVLFCGYSIPSELLLWLLSFPSLVDVRLFFCDSLTDGLIEKTVKRRHFQNLRVLALLRCHLVTNKGIDALLIDGNLISEMFFSHCNQLTLKNVSDWHKLARKKNWELFFYMQESITHVTAKFGERIHASV